MKYLTALIVVLSTCAICALWDTGSTGVVLGLMFFVCGGLAVAICNLWEGLSHE
jgi:hypothetical protein